MTRGHTSRTEQIAGRACAKPPLFASFSSIWQIDSCHIEEKLLIDACAPHFPVYGRARIATARIICDSAILSSETEQRNRDPTRHRPVPRRLLVHRRPRRAREGGVAGGREGPGAQAPARWAEEGRGGPAGPCEEGRGPPLPLAQEPGEPHRGAGRRARRPQVHGHRALARPPAQGGVPRRLQSTGRGSRRGRGEGGAPGGAGVGLPTHRNSRSIH